jgi:hypothetical protein
MPRNKTDKEVSDLYNENYETMKLNKTLEDGKTSHVHE